MGDLIIQLIGILFAIGLIFGFIRLIIFYMTFKGTGNPYRRECKKCGAIQEEIQLNGRPLPINYWEVTKEGNNKNCICNSFAEYYEY